jgi:hypothetical protein
MADSDGHPDAEELTRQALADLVLDVEEAKASGAVLLNGPASVQLNILVEDATTPQEAVEIVIRRIAHVGLDTFTFAVTDLESGHDHFVRAGQLFGLDEVQAAIEAEQSA